MPGILDLVADRHVLPADKQYRPAVSQHFLALRLAVRLNDVGAIQHYVELSDRYAAATLIAAYREATATGKPDLSRTFHALLDRINNDSGELPKRDLAAIRIERRAVAVAIFEGCEFKYPPMAHQLSSDPHKALGSAAIFINRLKNKCAFDNAVIESLPPGCEAQRSQLAQILTDVLVQRQVTVWRFDKAEVLAAFGHPPLRYRRQVREVMAAMFSEVNGSFGGPLIQDALALGLYCQIEHFLEK